MGDIAEQADGKALEIAPLLANGKDVEEALGGVLVGSIAGIDDAAFEVVGKQGGCARDGVANDDDIDAHGFDVFGGVDEGFAFVDGGDAGGKVGGFRAESAGCETETGAGAGGGFKEEGDDGFAAKVVAFFALAPAGPDEVFGGIEQVE